MGCWALLFYFKGTPSWILPKAFCRQLSPKYVFMQILKGAANRMQHLLICFSLITAPTGMVRQSLYHHINGATKIKNRFPF
jgi:hypothetical protein